MSTQNNKYVPFKYAPPVSWENCMIFDESSNEVSYIYYNPDSTAGGQYVIIYITKSDVEDAMLNSDNTDEFFKMLEESCYTELIDITDNAFEETDVRFCESKNAVELDDETKVKLIDFFLG